MRHDLREIERRRASRARRVARKSDGRTRAASTATAALLLRRARTRSRTHTAVHVHAAEVRMPPRQRLG